MGDKSAQKCYDILHSNMEIPLEVFLGALSIPMIGQSTIKAIMGAGCNTLEKFGQLGANQFSQVPGVGPTKSESLAQGLKDNQQLILSLLDNGIKIKEIIMGKLSGKSFAITGTLSMKRAEVEKLITDNGGEMKSSVGKTTTYLIIADPASTSSKAQSARKLGVKLIDENDLFDMVD
jgi:DNA ligase (NAD+)